MHLNQISRAMSTTLENGKRHWRCFEYVLWNARRGKCSLAWSDAMHIPTTTETDCVVPYVISKGKDLRLVTKRYDFRVNIRIYKYLEQWVSFQIFMKFYLYSCLSYNLLSIFAIGECIVLIVTTYPQKERRNQTRNISRVTLLCKKEFGNRGKFHTAQSFSCSRQIRLRWSGKCFQIPQLGIGYDRRWKQCQNLKRNAFTRLLLATAYPAFPTIPRRFPSLCYVNCFKLEAS